MTASTSAIRRSNWELESFTDAEVEADRRMEAEGGTWVPCDLGRYASTSARTSGRAGK